MRNFKREMKHPVTGTWEMASWIDDKRDRHRCGVSFPSDHSNTLAPWKSSLKRALEQVADAGSRESPAVHSGGATVNDIDVAGLESAARRRSSPNALIGTCEAHSRPKRHIADDAA
jgi:hypothetical protein